MRTGDGFFCVCSIISKESFTELNNFREQILRVKDTEDWPMVIAANKSDLESQRVVTPEELKALAEKYKCPYRETSAKLRKNIDEAFNDLVKVVRDYRKIHKPDLNDGNELPVAEKKRKNPCSLL